MHQQSRLFWRPSSRTLHQQGHVFDGWFLEWRAGDGAEAGDEPVDPVEALRRLHAARSARRVPIAVIGPKQANAEQLAIAHDLGRRIGLIGAPLLTGGKGGVMEAASRGCLEAGGDPIGLIPEEDWRCANDFVVTPLATGIGPARNALIARAACALIAVGGEYGTLSEIAFGLHFGKRVFTLADAPVVAGAVVCADVGEALAGAASAALGLFRPVAASAQGKDASGSMS